MDYRPRFTGKCRRGISGLDKALVFGGVSDPIVS
jgi:hypothetical protein